MDRVLNQKLGPEFVSQRPGPGGSGKLTYVEGWRVINIANQVFGYNGWSSSVVNITTDFIDCSQDSARYSVGVSALVRVTLSDGTFHEDVGFGTLENSKSKAAALDKCKKEAVTDALKRSLRQFGNVLGNCLYDKAYAQQVAKLKVPQHQFDPFDLYHGPEQPQAGLDADVKPSARSTVPSHSTKPAPDPAPASRSVASALPPHLRTSTSLPASHNNSTPAKEIGTPLSRIIINTGTGLVTPAKTPDHRPIQSARPHHNTIARAQSVNHTTTTTARTTGSRVSFADSPTESLDNPRATEPKPNSDHAADDSAVSATDCLDDFPFFSQDDALLADIDLTSVDLGRPIDFGEGMGRADRANDEEGMKAVDTRQGRKSDACTASNVPGPGPITAAQGQGQTRQAGSTAFQPNLQNRQAPMTSTSIRNQNRTVPVSSATGTATAVQNQNQAPKPNQDQGQHRKQQAASVISHLAETNNNSTVPSTSRIAEVTAMKRPPAPSMGGFHFPHGMNPLAAHPPSGSSTSLTPSSAVTIGVKRPAETPLPTRRPPYGMGLAHQQQQQVHLKREPLGRLDGVGNLDPAHENGNGLGHEDAKRVRR